MRTFNVTRLAVAALFLSAVSCGGSLSRPVAPNQSALLSLDQARLLTDQCSRPAPSPDSMWQPSDADIRALEANLRRLEGRRASECCIRGARIKDVDKYLRQYAGVVVAGRRYIYVSALSVSSFENWPTQAPLPNWRAEAYVVCDGGSSYWGVLYDPLTRSFTQLAFNGIG